VCLDDFPSCIYIFCLNRLIDYLKLGHLQKFQKIQVKNINIKRKRLNYFKKILGHNCNYDKHGHLQY